MRPLQPFLFAFALTVHLFAGAAESAPGSLPADWIDPDTGHRILRLSTEAGSSTLYFHDNSYSPTGDKLIFNSPSGVVLLDISRLGSAALQPEVVVPQARGPYMARRTPEIYFVRGGNAPGRGEPPPNAQSARDGAAGAPASPPAPAGDSTSSVKRGGGRGGFGGGEVFAYNFATKEIRKVPHAARTLINADETFTLATFSGEDPTGATPKPPAREARPQLARMFPGKTLAELTPEQRYAVNKEDGLARRTVNPPAMAFTFTNLKTGEAKTVGYQYGSLNHMQFSPTDPNLLLYCHEGTWHEVDRIWTIRTDGTAKTLRHKRTMDMEIAGHEFWSHDGKTIWFDLQTPRSQVFWIAGVDLTTGQETRYSVARDAWSVHYNVSRDNRLFMGDGGDPTQVAFAPDGMWINLFRPQADGSLVREKLVNMSKHNYVTGRGGIEPNGSITPDNEWVVFSGNFHGARHVYAVQIAR